MIAHRVAERYAKALVDSLGDTEVLDSASQWLRGFVTVLGSHPELAIALSNPSIRIALRVAILDDVLKHLHATDTLARFCHAVLRRGRFRDLSLIALRFDRLADLRLNRMHAQVTTSRELDAEDAERIRAGLREYTGRDVKIAHRVDPSILAGVVVRYNNTVVDGSLRARLEQLRKHLLSEENGIS